MLLTLIYIRVAALLANSKRFVLLDLVIPLSYREQSTHFTSSRNEIRIVYLKLPHART